MGLPRGLIGKEYACNAWDMCLTPGLGRSPGGGHGNTLQYSFLGNPMDREAWRAIVRRVTQSWTQSKWLSWAEGKHIVSFKQIKAHCFPEWLCWFTYLPADWEFPLLHSLADAWNYQFLKFNRLIHNSFWFNFLFPWLCTIAFFFLLKIYFDNCSLW